jgi:flagellar hook-associated protein 1 FlgK
VGNRAREIHVQSDAQTALVQQTTAAQQSVSGVNLDEEAANLIRFQQAYQASGRVLQIASKLFDTILGIGS